MNFLTIFVILVSVLFIFFIVRKFIILNQISGIEKKGDYALGARRTDIAKRLYKKAIKRYFKHFVHSSILKGHSIKGIRKEYEEFKGFKNRIISKLNSFLLKEGYSAISTEESDKYEETFLDKLNFKDPHSFKKENYDYDKFVEFINNYEKIIDKEFE